MVIANEVVNENYFLISLNGHGKSERDIFILGINIHFFFINSVKIHYEMDENLVYLDDNNVVLVEKKYIK